jgi:hypothetical protein
MKLTFLALLITFAASFSHASPLPVVDDVSKADAGHVFVTSKYGHEWAYKEDAQDYSQGWRDGWAWESSNHKLNTGVYSLGDNIADAEPKENALYGPENGEGTNARDYKSMGFEDAVCLYRDSHHIGPQDAWELRLQAEDSAIAQHCVMLDNGPWVRKEINGHGYFACLSQVEYRDKGKVFVQAFVIQDKEANGATDNSGHVFIIEPSQLKKLLAGDESILPGVAAGSLDISKN